MKAIIYEEQGAISAMKLVDLPIPQIEPDECLVKTEAIGLNGFDPMMALGTTELKTPLPMIPCGDGAGIIETVGSDANNIRKKYGLPPLRVGDRVSLFSYVPGKGMMGEVVHGTARDYFNVSALCLLHMPDALSFVHAAALPIAYGTAYRLVHTRADIKAGEKVLILGAAGGVGTCAIQLAKNLGAEVIACSSSETKLKVLKVLGADHLINTSEEDFVEATRAIAGRPGIIGDEGVDVVINYIGGESWAKAMKVIRRGGRMVTCGATDDYAPQTDLRYIWSFELSMIGSNGWQHEDQIQVMELAAKGKIMPFIHSVRPMADAAQAIQDLADRKIVGKTILLPDGSSEASALTKSSK